ncbi:ATP-binding protein [Paraburkholderia sp. BL6669N2]|uniref:ATP-binding protein n=1 Tax=Paraburkholderia sp. BL6669N2 TaxID=1938807 RepID=UPI002163F962|nr:ATP-binding protein [Paraburkholderia sp. BL6669N2]
MDFATVTIDVVEYYESAAEDKRVTLDYHRAPDRPLELHGDRDLLFEAQADLIDNAIKFAPEGGHVSIQPLPDATGHRHHDRRRRPWPPPEERQAVLRRFYRAETSTHTAGSGLGLSLAAVATMHGMALRLNDVATGCSIALYAPRGRNAAARRPPPRE